MLRGCGSTVTEDYYSARQIDMVAISMEYSEHKVDDIKKEIEVIKYVA